jgi:hypothetical protein
MLNQIQVSPVVLPLSALLAHPEFQRGLAAGHEFFFESYEPEPLSEEEMIEEVELNLTRRVTEHSRLICRLEGVNPPSYLYNLGFVVGTIDKGLSYAR